MNGRSILERRVEALEAILLKRSVSKDCRCRHGQETLFHTAADLARIMSVPCPLHSRELGTPLWVPPGTPLRPDDRHLCGCPPSPTRDWLEGGRGPLTVKEQEDECLSWEIEPSAETKKKLRIEEQRIVALLQTYFRKKRSHHATDL
jgi:hypothetical protein